MSRKLDVLALHDAGLRPVEIARRLGCTYLAAYGVLRRAGLRGNSVRPKPAVPATWTAGALRDAIAGVYGVAWRRLANRLTWLYGEAEALRRVNSYASERIAA